ncbi:MAG: hypothetical protein FWD15_02480 [Alphaproteobacteria bacterium]|nr:hypothetical protein [Alphaproteobacteria bacterium]
MEIAESIFNPYLLGHEAVEAELAAAVKAGTLHHSLIICGERGIGKATLAGRLARYLFVKDNASAEALPAFDFAGVKEEETAFSFGFDEGETEEDNVSFIAADSMAARPAKSSLRDIDIGALRLPETHPIFEKMRVGGVADFKYVCRMENERGKLAADITIEQVRELKEFFSTTASEGGWRVALIDCLDDMNTKSANAILKLLEEPPARSLLILVANNLRSVLPTIKSRCRIVRLAPLGDVNMKQLCDAYELPSDEISLRLAGGSIGRLAAFVRGGGAELKFAFDNVVADLRAGKFGGIKAFAESLRPEGKMQLWAGILDDFFKTQALKNNSEELFATREKTLSLLADMADKNLDAPSVGVQILKEIQGIL